MSDETTPGPDDLKTRIRMTLLFNSERSPQRELDDVMAVVQPELDRRDAEITRLRALWAAVAKDSRNYKAEADGRRQHAEELKAEIARLNGQVAGYENGLNWHTTCLGCATLLDSCYAETMRAERAEGERDQLKVVVGKLLTAQGRMLDDWAESSPERRRELWRSLHETADEVREILDQPGEPPCPTT